MRPRHYWQNPANQRAFLEQVAKELNIKSPQDWGEVTTKQIIEKGLSGLLQRHKKSLEVLLKFAFPGKNKLILANLQEIKWNPIWFSRVKWSTEKQKAVFDKIGKDFGITSPNQWSKVSLKDIYDAGGAGFITHHYSSSIYKALKTIYPDIDWKKEWFPHIHNFSKGYWKIRDNQRKFLEDFAKFFKIQHPRDWGSITYHQISDMGGKSCLHYYQNNIAKMMVTVFPEIPWKPSWFRRKEKYYPRDYFEALTNQNEFINAIAKQYHLKTANDWRKVSMNLIYKKGGRGLLKIYNSSIYDILRTLFPNNDWSLLKSYSSESRPQLDVQSVLLQKHTNSFSHERKHIKERI